MEATPTKTKEKVLNRESDRERPYPNGKRVDITERELTWLEALQDGPMSAEYLHAHTKHLPGCTAYNRAQDHVTDLYHEWPSLYFDGQRLTCRGVIERPNNQFIHRFKKLVYQNKPGAFELLKDTGRLLDIAPKYGGPFPHQYMGACVYHSLKLACLRGETLRFVSQQEIMQRAGKRNLSIPVEIHHPETGEVVTVYSYKYKKLVRPHYKPDAVCGIEKTMPDGSTRLWFFILEVDLNTEAVWSMDFTKKTFLRSYMQIRKIIYKELYKEFFNLENAEPIVLWINAIAARNQSMTDAVLRLHPEGFPNIAFQHAPGFENGINPGPVLYQLYDEWWKVPGHDDFLMSDWEKKTT